MQHFTVYNTEGYSNAQLSAMNIKFSEVFNARFSSDYDDFNDSNEYKQLVARFLNKH